MKRNPTLPPNFMLGYANAAPNLQNCLRKYQVQITNYELVLSVAVGAASRREVLRITN
ncbi:hypothetical protein GNF10_25240 [Nostoc sp. UCD121]|uniref:hypothetical protein n=1 Tax=unclassified Nostoc TaxID=2593658 RepID=UPI001626D3CB|nr:MULTISPECIES: hypothetical protein [unclassified Nostoc]MBC1218629.1 hypothetical protein [Nostoc sp. UCD120]MBC1279177.1 hypothetical protein [Nostoc sp. UCD121]MBC1294940.1 hypothetical protein [Nostoc sp. UCD122]